MQGHIMERLRALLLVPLAALLLACGGGGGGGAPAEGLRDSFGRPVGAAEGFGPDDAGVDGTVTEGGILSGSPWEGAQVRLTDAAGRTASTVTDAQGYYRLKVTGFTAPFVLKAADPLYSFSVQPATPGRFQTVNITPLTEKLAGDVAHAADSVSRNSRRRWWMHGGRSWRCLSQACARS